MHSSSVSSFHRMVVGTPMRRLKTITTASTTTAITRAESATESMTSASKTKSLIHFTVAPPVTPAPSPSYVCGESQSRPLVGLGSVDFAWVRVRPLHFSPSPITHSIATRVRKQRRQHRNSGGFLRFDGNKRTSIPQFVAWLMLAVWATPRPLTMLRRVTPTATTTARAVFAAAWAWQSPQCHSMKAATFQHCSNGRGRRDLDVHAPSARSSHTIVLTAAPRNAQDSIDAYGASEMDSTLSHILPPAVQWYPGHIAKAERQLQETFKAVDVVVEVRDARAPLATAHPSVSTWCAGRPRLVVLTHGDQVPAVSRSHWMQSLYQQQQPQPSFSQEGVGGNAADVNAVMDLQVQNQARQFRRELLKYTASATASAGERKLTVAVPHNKNRRPFGEGGGSDYSLAAIESVLLVNAKTGQGVHALTRAIARAGSFVQVQRSRRGLQPRALRVGVLGYPNVGKSALINQLLGGRKRARTANTPGVTRTLQWIRVGGSNSSGSSITSSSGQNQPKRHDFELLDSPGVIPASFLAAQGHAALLAACNHLGVAAYEPQAVAAYLCQWLLQLYRQGYGQQLAPQWRLQCQQRYGIDPISVDAITDMTSTLRSDPLLQQQHVRECTGEDMLFAVADRTCQGNPEDAARKILQDFRSGRMGPICLQIPPTLLSWQQQNSSLAAKPTTPLNGMNQEMREIELVASQQRSTHAAVQAVQERGLELPPSVVALTNNKQVDASACDDVNSNNESSEKQCVNRPVITTAASASQIGKGLFDGW